MKVPLQVIALSSLLTVSAVSAREHNLRRQLQFAPFEGEDPNGERPFDPFMADLTAGFEELFNITLIHQMDPLVLEEGNQTFFYGEDFLGITNCTGNISVELYPIVLTGLSTLVLDRFELVQNTEQIEQENWWSQFLTWSATFDLLARTDFLSIQTGVSIMPEYDTDCIPADLQSDDGSFSTGILMSMTNPALEVFLDMGGTTPGLLASFFGGDSTAENISADRVNFSWDSWTITFDNPGINQTINVTEVLEMFDLFLSDSFNLTDFGDITLDDMGDSTMENFETFGGFNGITDFIQEQTNVISKKAGFSF